MAQTAAYYRLRESSDCRPVRASHTGEVTPHLEFGGGVGCKSCSSGDGGVLKDNFNLFDL